MAWVEEVQDLLGGQLVADLHSKQQAEENKHQTLAGEVVRTREVLGHGVGESPSDAHRDHHGRRDHSVEDERSGGEEVCTLFSTVSREVRLNAPKHHIFKALPEGYIGGHSAS